MKFIALKKAILAKIPQKKKKKIPTNNDQIWHQDNKAINRFFKAH